MSSEEFYAKLTSGELKIITAEFTTVERYFAKNQKPILVTDDEHQHWMFMYSPEALESAQKRVHINLITQEAYLMPEENENKPVF